MIGNIRFSRWLVGAVVLAVAECASVAAIDVALTQPAQAQRADDRYPFLSRQRQHGGFFGFGGLFGGGGYSNSRPYPGESNSRRKFNTNLNCTRRRRANRIRMRPRPRPRSW